jgi:diguanylate cyclase (GGDEF)-like protein/PAS domain S-box-containing protein
MTGYSKNEVIGRSPRFLQGPKTSREERRRIRNALQSRAAVCAELINYRKDGTEYWLEATIAPVLNQHGDTTHFVSVQRDVTQRKASINEIERLAFYDQLTGLPNRRLLLDRLQHQLEHMRRKECYSALMMIDLDDFKLLNDTLGHDMGDLLLQQVACRLEGVVKRSNTVARLGGDEFVIVLEDLDEQESKAAAAAETIAEKILAVFKHSFYLENAEHYCTPSIGITLFHEGTDDPTTLFKRADVAMYQAKAAGRNTARFFDPQTQAEVNARIKLEHDLRLALVKEEFELHYQPQADMQGRIIGAEALVRWADPQRGLITPAEFIPLAEETGFISQLGQWILSHACKRLQRWTDDPLTRHLSLSVNISAIQFRHPDFVSTVIQIIQATGIDPTKLKLEVTESMLIERLDEAIVKMNTLKERGVQFALDDFGTGYSSLSYLRQLPLDQIKIDQTFVAGVLANEHDAAITSTIISLGRILGLEVVAEGVETEGQRDFLTASGCHGYQGFLFSKPVTPSHFPVSA